MIQVDLQNVRSFIPLPYEAALSPRLRIAHDHLQNGDGAGGEFTGWVRLPEDYDKAEFARMELYDMLLPALGMVAIKGLAQGLFSGDDDDDKELVKLALSTTMGQFAMAVPVLGNPAADMLVAAMGAGGGRRADLSTALDTPLQLAGKIAGQGGKVARGGDVDGEKLVMSALDLGSYISKIPVGPVTRRARRGYEQWQEGEGTPLSVIMPRAN